MAVPKAHAQLTAELVEVRSRIEDRLTSGTRYGGVGIGQAAAFIGLEALKARESELQARLAALEAEQAL